MPPTKIASSSLLNFSIFRNSLPVCNVRVRSPSATLNRMRPVSMPSAYIILAFARVLPLPVDAMLIPKKPCFRVSLPIFCANFLASSCQPYLSLSFAITLCASNVLGLGSSCNKLLCNFGKALAIFCACSATPIRCSSSCCLSCLVVLSVLA